MTALKLVDQVESPAELTAMRMADCISSGLAGMPLVRALHRHFPTASRADAFLAIGMVMAIMEADLTAAEIELQAHRAQNGGAA